MEDALAAAEEAVALAPDARARGRALNRARGGAVVARPPHGGARGGEGGDRGARADGRRRRARPAPTPPSSRMEAVAFDPAARDRRRRARRSSWPSRRRRRRRGSTWRSASRSRTAIAASRARSCSRPRAPTRCAAGLHIQVVRSYVNELERRPDARDHATVDALAPEAIALFEERELATPAEYVIGRAWRAACSTAGAGTRRSSAPRPAGAAGTAALRSRRWWTGSSPPARGQDGGARLARGRRRPRRRARGRAPRARPGGARARPAWLHGDRAASASTRWRGCARRTPSSSRARPGARAVGRAAGATVPAAPSPLPRRAGAARARGRLARRHRRLARAARALRGRARRAPRRRARGPGRGGGAAPARRDRRRPRLRPRPRRARAPRRCAGRGAPRSRTRPASPAASRRCSSHVAAGATNADIARTLHLSERTVEHHVSAILAKLEAPTRTAAVQAAREAGLQPGWRAAPKMGDRADPAPQRRT